MVIKHYDPLSRIALLARLLGFADQLINTQIPTNCCHVITLDTKYQKYRQECSHVREYEFISVDRRFYLDWKCSLDDIICDCFERSKEPLQVSKFLFGSSTRTRYGLRSSNCGSDAVPTENLCTTERASKVPMPSHPLLSTKHCPRGILVKYAYYCGPHTRKLLASPTHAAL